MRKNYEFHVLENCLPRMNVIWTSESILGRVYKSMTFTFILFYFFGLSYGR